MKRWLLLLLMTVLLPAAAQANSPEIQGLNVPAYACQVIRPAPNSYLTTVVAHLDYMDWYLLAGDNGRSSLICPVMVRPVAHLLP